MPTPRGLITAILASGHESRPFGAQERDVSQASWFCRLRICHISDGQCRLLSSLRLRQGKWAGKPESVMVWAQPYANSRTCVRIPSHHGAALMGGCHGFCACSGCPPLGGMHPVRRLCGRRGACRGKAGGGMAGSCKDPHMFEWRAYRGLCGCCCDELAGGRRAGDACGRTSRLQRDRPCSARHSQSRCCGHPCYPGRVSLPGSGLGEWLARNLGLSNDEVCCFGDAENDLPLLTRFKNSVAVANATPVAAKAARWHIGRADQDAVADAIFDIARSTAAGEMPSFMRGEDAASASDKRSSR